jgi:hypothetical protein
MRYDGMSGLMVGDYLTVFSHGYFSGAVCIGVNRHQVSQQSLYRAVMSGSFPNGI